VSGEEERPTIPGRGSGGRALVPILASVVLLGAVVVVALTTPGGSGPSPSPPPSSGPGPSPAAGQVTAHHGRFWLGSRPIVLRGVLMPLSGPASRFARVASWGMNLVRLQVNWARLEPSPPTRGPGGSWVHAYDQTYLARVVGAVRAAQAGGLWVVVGNYRDRLTFFGYPDWLYRPAFNSHRMTYPRTHRGFLRAETDFWTDPLRQRLTSEMLRDLAGSLAGVPGILGYEMLNEPQRGTLPLTRATVQRIVDWQASAAGGVRRADPPRVVFFMAINWNDVGLPVADLSGFVNLGNASLDFHDYFGARWGSGWLQDRRDPAYHLDNEHVFATVSISPNATAPYIGSAWVQERQIRAVLDVLKPTGITLMVGEFGDYAGDPGIERLYGTMTSAFNALGVSWATNWLGIVTDNVTATPEPWARIVIAAARAPAPPG
jgi:cellulase (glycosyl hydrolase family 5)